MSHLGLSVRPASELGTPLGRRRQPRPAYSPKYRGLLVRERAARREYKAHLESLPDAGELRALYRKATGKECR
jgi:hypothetical protein